jgi:hypothetical protein
MSLSTIGLAVLAAAILWAAGFLFGSGRASRAKAQSRLEPAHGPNVVNATVIKAEIASAVRPLMERDQRVLEERLGDLVSNLDARRADAVEVLLRPLLERERISSALVGLSARVERAQSLMDVLDAIARSGSFLTVLLSDEVGLPLAVNQGGVDPDVHAGMASMLLTFFDRVASNGQPAPLAAVFRDEANRMILHRAFRCQGTRFVLTAVSLGMPVAPEALDPALVSIEKLLNRSSWAPGELR